ncbi:N-acetyltransferase [Niameybacter massiliensis]|uniref:N-acetyltransferase n=1 Tax=Holtiella tumoricola TaxID=3018743 RepID=A0AA42DLY2_9FIRM|nr:N-acetyltransferase [Holtiella tumoricola]MDA3731083.1 N-acetyltransferase [Holtiella tumoricola]
MNLTIKREQEADYRTVENLTREAFWNVYKPGCDEHFILNQLRGHGDFIPELDLVAGHKGEIVGHIAYSKGTIIDDKGNAIECVAFGPLSVAPECQGKGVGGKLIEHSLEVATQLGYKVVFITGNPAYYHKFGFESASKYGIHLEDIPQEDEAPFFMVKLLNQEALKNVSGTFRFSSGFEVSAEDVAAFDQAFPPKIKEVREGQLS